MSDLQHEIKKREPFHTIEEETMLNLLRTSDQIQNRLGKLFREFGVTSSQYNVLRILRGEGKPLPILEVASRMIQVVPAITGLIDRLEKQGFVRRERCEEDRRVIYVCITPAGGKLLGKMDEPLQTLNRALLGHFSKTELKELSRLLAKARQATTVTE